MEWFLRALKKYADFGGRARRKEFWMFTLCSFLISIAISAIMVVAIVSDSFNGMIIFFTVYGLYYLFIFIPTLSVSVRRLHDAGKSGWMLLIMFIPLIGSLWLLMLLCAESQYGENQWGYNPKGIGNKTDLDEIGMDNQYS